MTQPQDGADQDRVAVAFVAARKEVRHLEAYPGCLPDSLEAAYAIQDRAIRLWNEGIGGWKVGRIMPPLDTQVGANRLAGPIFAPQIIFEASGKPISMDVFAPGFAAAEAEFLLRVSKRPDSGKLGYSLDEAAEHIDAVHVGIEIASSPLEAINDLGPAVTISDFGNNNGLVIGAAISDWRNSDFADWPVSLLIDGAEAGKNVAREMPDGPLGAARFLLELCARRKIALEPGQWISSGAVTGVHRVAPGQLVEAKFGQNHEVSCTIEAAAANEARSKE